MLTRLAKLFLPQIRAREGKVLDVASVAAFLPGPYMAIYYASKAFVLHFSEALAEELSGTGATVTCLCPGPVKTNFQGRAKLGDTSWRKVLCWLRMRGRAGRVSGYEAGQAGGGSRMEEPRGCGIVASVAA